MPAQRIAAPSDVAIVSCDIVGHSSADLEHQISRVASINAIIAEVIQACGEEEMVWASGGDGGHVIFRQAAWHSYAVELITRLRQWSLESRVPLRVTAHIGEVTYIIGADGRLQPVGDGINTAGWMLTVASDEGVIVSEAFREAVESMLPEQDIAWHDPRVLRDKNLTGQRLILMSIGGDHSRWATPRDADREELSSALDKGAGWEVLYFAKRILQANTIDAQASQAIQRLGPLQLLSQTVTGIAPSETNPFLGYLDPSSLYEIVQLGQLVERRYNEIICRHGDQGDTMFVILRGEVGVYNTAGKGSDDSAEAAFILREGEIVGELAFAFGRSRTADLIALGDVALLSFNYNDISARLPRTPAADRARERVLQFITGRALEHVSHSASYLLGPERTGPLAAGTEPWKFILGKLEDYTLLIPADPHKLNISIDDLKPSSPAYSGHGIYILTTGQLRGGVDGMKKINGDSFPLLWVDIPDVVVSPRYSFDVEAEPVQALYIDARSLGPSALEPAKREALYAAVRRALASCYYFDAFISYNFLDEPAAKRWKDALGNKGLKIYVDTPKSGAEFPPRLTAALLDSRAMIALISPNAMVREPTQNWIVRETDFQREYFQNPSIFPVLLPGGQHEQLIPGFAPIDARTDENAAIEEVAHELFLLREGKKYPPYRLQDMREPKLT